MKATERHKLKENEFARTVANARHVLETWQRDLGAIALVVVVAPDAGAAGCFGVVAQPATIRRPQAAVIIRFAFIRFVLLV